MPPSSARLVEDFDPAPLVRAGRHDLKVVPDRTPESLRVIDRPLPHIGVGFKWPPRAASQRISSEIGPFEPLSAWTPQHLACLDSVIRFPSCSATMRHRPLPARSHAVPPFRPQ